MVKVEIKTVKVGEIKLNPDNPRTISKKDMALLVKSLKDFPEMLELREIVVDEGMTILGGNMRYLALQKSGVKEATAKIVTGLTADQKREFVIKDNGGFGQWDMDALANAWADLPLADWGVDLPEDWLGGDKGEPADAEPQIDKAEELNKVWRVTLGDLWQIGQHRLLCGDSTKKEDVGRVMGGEKADMVFTDPPYGVGVAGGSHDPRDEKNYQSGGTIKGDALQDDELYELWTAALKLSGRVACEGSPVYVCFSDSRALPCLRAFIDAGLKYSQLIIWAKQQMVFGRKDYHSQHEPIMYGWVNGAAHNEVKTRTQTTLWQIDRPMRSEKEHPTQKPIELPQTAMSNHDSPIIIDPFLGSGTTMVACQNLNRKCRGIEISPDYCAVILQRMHDAFPDLEIRRIE